MRVRLGQGKTLTCYVCVFVGVGDMGAPKRLMLAATGMQRVGIFLVSVASGVVLVLSRIPPGALLPAIQCAIVKYMLWICAEFLRSTCKASCDFSRGYGRRWHIPVHLQNPLAVITGVRCTS